MTKKNTKLNINSFDEIEKKKENTKVKKIEENNDFLELIENCKKQNSESLEKFFELYSMEIYNFPIKVFHFSEEDAGDFFLFAFERLKDGKRFRTFRGDSSFRTWFFSVLRNLVLDWLRMNKKNKGIQFYNYDSFLEIEKHILEDLKENNDANILKEEFYKILDNLDPESRIVFKLTFIFYLDLNEVDIQILRDIYNKSQLEILEFITELKEFLTNKNLKLKKKSERLQRIYLKLLKLKQKEYELTYNKSFENIINSNYSLTEVQNKIEKKKENRNKILNHSNPEATLIRAPFHKIAKFLNISVPTVSSIYKKAEKTIKNSKELKKIFTNE